MSCVCHNFTPIIKFFIIEMLSSRIFCCISIWRVAINQCPSMKIVWCTQAVIKAIEVDVFKFRSLFFDIADYTFYFIFDSTFFVIASSIPPQYLEPKLQKPISPTYQSGYLFLLFLTSLYSSSLIVSGNTEISACAC